MLLIPTMVLVVLWSPFFLALVYIFAWTFLLICGMMAARDLRWTWSWYQIGLVSDVSSLSPVGGSDHVVVRCCLSVRPKLLPPATRLRRVWKYEDVDLEKVNGLLSHLDWSSVTSVSPVDSAWGISGGRSLYLLSRNMCHPS